MNEQLYFALEKIESVKGTNRKKELLIDTFMGIVEAEEFFRLALNNTIYGISIRSFEKICDYDLKADGIYFDSGDLISRKIRQNVSRNIFWSIEEIRKFLKTLKELSGNEALEHLKKLLDADSFQAKWLTRLILKDLKLGISLISINEVLVKLGRAKIEKFELQLCDKIDSVDEFSYGYPVLVAIKYDGIRGFLTKEKKQVVFTSRNGKIIDYIPELNNYFKNIYDDFVLDGEILCKDFSTLQKRIGRKEENLEPIESLHFRLFDILKFNNIDFAEKEQLERTKFIKQTFIETDFLKLEENFMVHNKKELESIFKHACVRQEEGIIIKLIYEKYEFGSRKNWIKLKPIHEATFKIVDKKLGTGKKSGLISSLLVEDASGKIKSYVGSGLTDDDILIIMGLDRENKLIGSFVDISYNEITVDKFGSKSLRFPRVLKLRTDKAEADNLDE